MRRLLTVIFVIIFTVRIYGAFEDTGKDARARGMGNAFYGEPAGVSSIYYNPAGTAFSKKIEVIGTFGLPYFGLDAINMNTFNGAVIFPFTYHFGSEVIFKNSVIGVGLNNFSLDYGNSDYYSDDDISYYERQITINLSKDLLNILGIGTRFAVGANFNILMRGLGSNIDADANRSYFINGLDTSGFGIDLGFMMFLNMNMILGVVIDNIIEPNVAFNKEHVTESIDKNVKIGLSFKNDKLWIFKYSTIAGGIAFTDLKSDVWEYRFGFEFWEFKRTLGVRFGYQLSDEGMNNITFGLTGKKKFKFAHTIEASYSFIMPIATVRSSYGSHMFSIAYKYSMPAYKFEFDDRKRRDMIDKLEEAKQKQLENLKKEEAIKKFDKELKKESTKEDKSKKR